MLPELGGRLISLRHRDREFLWHDPELLDEDFRRRVPVAGTGTSMADWQNWGGDKSWPAPQAVDGGAGWHGPPDPVLDGGPYRVITRDGRSILLRSEVDGRTGLQQTRSITVDDSGVRVGTTIANRSSAPVRLAPWEVMQVAVSEQDETAPGFVEVEHAAGGVVDLGRYWGLPRVARHGSSTRVGFGCAVAKLGFAGATGRVRCRFADGAELRLAFEPAAAAPDSSPFQLWLQTPLDHAPDGLDGWRPQHRLIELEPVGALRELAPGDAETLAARWTVLAPPPGPADRW